VTVNIFALTSCDQIVASYNKDTSSSKYPIIRNLVNGYADRSLALIKKSNSRSVAVDSKYAALAKVFSLAKNPQLTRSLAATGGTDMTSEELSQIDALLNSDPQLAAGLQEISSSFQEQVAAIPPLEVAVQPLDENDQPVDAEFKVTSDNGMINFGNESSSVIELLDYVQTQPEAARGFAIADDYDGEFGGTKWPDHTVKYYFEASALSGLNILSSEKEYMRAELEKLHQATGIVFKEESSSVGAVWWAPRRFKWVA
jgi:hypothetical protein